MSADPRTTAPTLGRLTAPAAWQNVDLISDLHLQASEPATFEAWRQYMANTPADAVLILGDLFEVWVGDDATETDPFLQSCAQVLRHTAPSMQGWGYAVFGKVIKGTDVVDQIKGVQTGNRGGHGDVPKEDVVIEKAVAL